MIATGKEARLAHLYQKYDERHLLASIITIER